MAKIIPSAYERITLGNVLNGRDIKTPEWAGLLEPAHGQMVRFGARHRLLGTVSPWQTTSATYTTTPDSALAPRLHAFRQGLRLWRDWTTLAQVRRVGLVAWAYGTNFDLELELWAEDTNALWDTLNPVQASSSFIWASDALEVDAEDARKGGLIGNDPRLLFPKMSVKFPGGTTMFLYEIILQEYVITDTDV
jgi:hypothetical protein